MPPDPDPLADFLRRARRQAWRSRVGDTAVVALAAAAGTWVGGRLLGLTTPAPAAAVFVVVLATTLRTPPSMRTIAGRLDARHRTGDLLLSAWCTAPTEPWSRAVRTMAAARVAALPPVGRPARLSTRHRLCLLAAAAAAGLATQLTPPAAGPPRVAAAAGDVSESGPARQVAAEVIRRGDTGQSNAGVPSRSDTAPDDAGQSTRRARPAGDDAHGGGRADAPDAGSFSLPDAAGTAVPRAAGPAGAGPASDRGGASGTSGAAVTPEAAKASTMTGAASTSVQSGLENRTNATPVPDAYRPIIAAFFAR